MGIRSVMLFVVFIGFLFTLLITFLIHRNVVHPVFLKAEIAMAEHNNERPKAVLLFQQKNLGEICHDWSSWDDSWEFVNDLNLEYVDANLGTESYQNLGVSVIAFLDTNGNIIWGKMASNDANALFPVSKKLTDSLYMCVKNKQIPLATGFIVMNKSPSLFSIRPILKSNGGGPSRGWLIMGKNISGSLLDEMRYISQTNFQIHYADSDSLCEFPVEKIDSGVVNTITHDSIFSKSCMKDIYGKTSFFIETSTDRLLNRFGKQQEVLAMLGNLVGLLAVLLLMLICLHFTIASPIVRLIRQINIVNQAGKYATKINVEGCREVVDLGRIFNSLLSRVHHDTQTLAKLSETDGLTGIPNRRRFDEYFQDSWANGVMATSELSVIIIDVDNFKKYNDSCGHQAGDRCLRTVAEVIKRNALYTGDFPARYGGEEFAMVLEKTGLDGALIVAERVRADLERLQLPHPGSELGVVTISLGVASVVPSADSSPERLFARADTALYRAKELGRNRVETTAEI